MQIRIKNNTYFFPFGDILSYSRPLEYFWITKYAEIGEKDIVCDIACGNGFWSNLVAKKSLFLSGIDLNFERIRQAKHKYGSKNRVFLLADAQKIPIKSSSHTCIVSFCALEHFSSDVEALHEMRRIIAKNGILSMSVDSMSLDGISSKYLDFHKKKYFVNNYYTLMNLKAKLLQTGFQIERYHYLTTTVFSSFIFLRAMKLRRLFQFLFPLLFPTTLLVDFLFGKQNGGHKLIIKARAI